MGILLGVAGALIVMAGILAIQAATLAGFLSFKAFQVPKDGFTKALFAIGYISLALTAATAILQLMIDGYIYHPPLFESSFFAIAFISIAQLVKIEWVKLVFKFLASMSALSIILKWFGLITHWLS